MPRDCRDLLECQLLIWVAPLGVALVWLARDARIRPVISNFFSNSLRIQFKASVRPVIVKSSPCTFKRALFVCERNCMVTPDLT